MFYECEYQGLMLSMANGVYEDIRMSCKIENRFRAGRRRRNIRSVEQDTCLHHDCEATQTRLIGKSAVSGSLDR